MKEAATIEVNGHPVELRSEALGELLEELGYATATRGIAVAVNGEVVPRQRWEFRLLKAGDRVDIVGAVQGG